MKRSFRVLALAAPAVGLGAWMTVNEFESARLATERPARLTDPSNPDFGRTRSLPETGPVSMDGAPQEMAISLEEVLKTHPELDPRLARRPPAQRQ